ncbi:unnamed protein product [Nyctereutes procyonoides]|uniref:(raccoon dog) hypothetical protein n=1 Tax=Nyctereutes procyonoides TaxID=34880 RepID=A0A811YZJ3_NYCPR|nr:unnamed protein product [Nyctereutes procyonoides]
MVSAAPAAAAAAAAAPARVGSREDRASPGPAATVGEFPGRQGWEGGRVGRSAGRRRRAGGSSDSGAPGSRRPEPPRLRLTIGSGRSAPALIGAGTSCPSPGAGWEMESACQPPPAPPPPRHAGSWRRRPAPSPRAAACGRASGARSSLRWKLGKRVWRRCSPSGRKGDSPGHRPAVTERGCPRRSPVPLVRSALPCVKAVTASGSPLGAEAAARERRRAGRAPRRSACGPADGFLSEPTFRGVRASPLCDSFLRCGKRRLMRRPGVLRRLPRSPSPGVVCPCQRWIPQLSCSALLSYPPEEPWSETAASVTSQLVVKEPRLPGFGFQRHYVLAACHSASSSATLGLCFLTFN